MVCLALGVVNCCFGAEGEMKNKFMFAYLFIIIILSQGVLAFILYRDGAFLHGWVFRSFLFPTLFPLVSGTSGFYWSLRHHQFKRMAALSLSFFLGLVVQFVTMTIAANLYGE